MFPMMARYAGAVLFTVAAGGAVTLAPPAAAQAAPGRPGCATVTPATLGGFFDTAIPQRMREHRVPGAVVSVVSGGTTAFAKGYGMADVERGVPFSATRSLVRVGSITKLFTWTAVMQQVEAGRLDLHADVNRYVGTGLRIPATYRRPVTLLDLMDHTAGFEDYVIGTSARRAGDVPPLDRYLAGHMPARIRPPGEVSAYSNYGAALAGYIVSRVSGEPYDAYVQRHLLDPLGMTHSTAAEPVPPALASDLARSYDSDRTPPRPVPFTFDPTPPDGSVSATATDMARFMNAHLHAGGLGAARILDPATTALMHQRSFAADPRLAGYAHGFADRTVNGHRVLMHDGGWEGFRSVLLLVPDCDLGLFLSFNGTGAESAAATLMAAIFDRFAPAPASGVVVPDAPRAATPRAGFYQPARHNESTVEKVAALLGPSRLTVDGRGAVHFRGKVWTPRPGGLYRATDGSDRLGFLAGEGGRRYVLTDGATYQMMPRSDTLPVNLIVLLVVLVPAVSALALPVAWAVRKATRRPARTTAAWRGARVLAACASVLGIAFLARLMATLVGNTDEFLYRVPDGFRVLLGLPLLVLAAGVPAAALTVTRWRGSGAGIIARIHQVCLLVGLGALAWFLWNWNLIGWQYS